MKHKLTKTDFIQYQNCPKSLWLLKNKPEQYHAAEFSLFLKKLIEQGAEVEEWATKLFPESPIYTQATYETEHGLLARIDILERLPDGSWHLYEVKSSTEVKTDKRHNHLKDACFQKYVIEQNGQTVSRVSIIHVNKTYVRQGDINQFGLLTITDVTEEVQDIYEQTGLEIEEAVAFINRSTIDERGCSCRFNTRTNHCDSFQYFNPDIPTSSIYEIGNIRQTKIQLLVDMGILQLSDIPDDFELNEKQQKQVLSVKKKRPLIDSITIAEQLRPLPFPLHFIDYETFSNAVPKIDGVRPYQHIPFQVSIHTLQSPDAKSLTHFEYLAEKMELPAALLQQMQSFTGTGGTYISWNKTFERDRNNDMAIFFPAFAAYLHYMNEHMFDLQDIFKTGYFDYQFHGSTSIKAVLPVLVPHMTYKSLAVQDGTMAMDTWERMVSDPNFSEDITETRKNLLTYCRQDTLAMVEIYRKLIVL